MESVVSALGELVLRAVPTFLILLLLHFYLKAVFYKPMDQALAARKQATAGVKKLAEESLRKAESKSFEYEEALRAARGSLYKEQEEKRAVWRTEQTAALAAMRENIDSMVRDARLRLASEKEAAKATLSAESEALAEQIARAVLVGGAN
jgi:F-type H+-transporting ATPase subunit b